jgi:hypothetical protein
MLIAASLLNFTLNIPVESSVVSLRKAMETNESPRFGLRALHTLLQIRAR